MPLEPTCLCNIIQTQHWNKHSVLGPRLHGYSPRDMIAVYIVMDIDRFAHSASLSHFLHGSYLFFSGLLVASLTSSDLHDLELKPIRTHLVTGLELFKDWGND